MRRNGGVRLEALALTLVMAVYACDDPTGLQPDEIAGTWDATAAVMRNVADANQTEDLIASGVTLSMTLGEDGSISTAIDLGFAAEVDSGTYTISGNEITMTLGGDVISGTVSRDGDQMEVSLTNGLDWDFDRTGLDVPSILDLVLVRRQ